MKLKARTYNGGGWHPDRPQIKVSGPTCSNCKRPLLVVNGSCLCCGKEA